MINVLEVIPSIGNGGAEKLVYDICKNIDKTNFNVTLLLYDDIKRSKEYLLKELKETNIKIICLNKKIGFNPKMFIKVYNIVKQINPDIIHMHLNVNLYLFPYFLFHKEKTGFQTIHNLAEKDQYGVHRKILSWLFKYRNVKPVAISQLIQESIVSLYKIENTKVPIIYNGIDTRTFKPFNNKNVNITKFIAVGRLTEQKNYPLMFNAFKNALEYNKNIELIILGDGKLRDQLEEKLKLLNLNQSVKLLGNVNNVNEQMAKADCFLMSSNYEGLPLSVLEAMSCGLPIVSTKAGGVVDVVKNKYNGILVDIGNENNLTEAILKLTNKKIQDEYGKHSLEMSQQYDIQNCTKRYQDLFNAKLN